MTAQSPPLLQHATNLSSEGGRATGIEIRNLRSEIRGVKCEIFRFTFVRNHADIKYFYIFV
jgi:hypothetical protein